jgi:enamine deaminase RidA (YjgF/YER057c/UK114 family)
MFPTKSTGSSEGPVASMRRIQDPNFDAAIFSRQRLEEIHATLLLETNEAPGRPLERLAELLRERKAALVKVEVFGDLSVYTNILGRFARLFPEFSGPFIWLEGKTSIEGAAGMHLWAVGGTSVSPVIQDGQVVGSTFNDGFARHVILNDVLPDHFSAAPALQAVQAFERLQNILEQYGMGFHQVARTWFYLDNILDWYGRFNRVRAGLFKRWKVFESTVPASTGIGVSNASGAALACGLWAVQPCAESFPVRELASPLQCPAPSYGSCFSRAVEIRSPDFRRILVSGTASIHPDGSTARCGDLNGQIELTMEVIEAILEANDMDFSDATRATAYFKDVRHAPFFADWRKRREIQLPVLMVQGEVCRDDLLFELELDALTFRTCLPASEEALESRKGALTR